MTKLEEILSNKLQSVTKLFQSMCEDILNVIRDKDEKDNNELDELKKKLRAISWRPIKNEQTNSHNVVRRSIKRTNTRISRK